MGYSLHKKRNLVTVADIFGPPASEPRISHKLYEGHHLIDVPSGKKAGKMKEKVLETVLESLPAPTSKFQNHPSKPSTSS